MSRCQRPVDSTLSPTVGSAQSSTNPTANVPSYAPGALARTCVSFPDASMPRTTKVPEPSRCACTISGSDRLAGSPTFRAPEPSTGTTVVTGVADVGAAPLVEHGAEVGVDTAGPPLPEHALATINIISAAATPVTPP